MSLEFFDKDKRPTIEEMEFIMFRFLPTKDGKQVVLQYVIEGGLDDWSTLYMFDEDEYFLMSTNKFTYDGETTLGLISSPDNRIEGKVEGSEELTLRGVDDESK